MKIMKFGGTSVGSPETIRQVGTIVQKALETEPCCIVVSAMGGITNQLIETGGLAKAGDENYKKKVLEIEDRHLHAARTLLHNTHLDEALRYLTKLHNELNGLLQGIFLLHEVSPRTSDLLVSIGERASTFLVATYLKQQNTPAYYLDARTVIKTDDRFSSARVDFTATNFLVSKHIKEHQGVPVVTGFISSSHNGETTTLGRGGSDYTAAIVGAAVGATMIEIWTDVNGVLTADPRKVPAAFSLDSLSYNEAMEISHFGAKVIYPPTLQPAFAKNIPLSIKNTFNPSFKGTLISKETDSQGLIVKGISSIQDISLINLSGSGMVGVPGVSSRLFGALAQNQINVVLITQASSEHSICLALQPSDAELAQKAIHAEFDVEIERGKIDKVTIVKELSVIAVIGENMRNTPGISAKIFTALGRNGISAVAIAQGSSELNISIVIEKRNLNKSLNALHEAFFQPDRKSIHVYLLGTGLIGSTLLHQIQKQKQYLLHEESLDVRVVALANSKKMVFDEKGLDVTKDKNGLLANGDNTSVPEFVKRMKAFNLPNSVFVDCTAGKSGLPHYEEILKMSVSVVTPNKLANSGPYEQYARLKKTALMRGVKFLYETNVGAGLPVIAPLKDLKTSGDRIIRIEGILSGTLSFIFNTFDGSKPFSAIVKMAKEKGFTEPDPRDDLSGLDVARKILILSREAGYTLEPEDVQVENILPKACLDAPTVDAFFEALIANDHVFLQRLETAKKAGNVLRFIASLENGKAQVTLQQVGPSHPFYHMSGSDNMIAFTTERYKEQPLVIKGPGAGAEVTAAGVFSEIISVANYMAFRD